MNWIVLTVASALLLGTYDFLKKQSVRDNAVPIVLLGSVCVGAAIWIPLIAFSKFFPAQSIELLRVDGLTLEQHGLIAAKSALVASSWTLAFIGLKHLPLSIAGPIRSTSPLWTILIAVVFVGERPSLVQWCGITIILASFLAFSFVGRREGIHFHRDRWVFSMVGATLLGAMSSIYDKYLLQQVGINAPTLQAWFSVYLVPMMLPLALRWYLRDRQRVPFQWRRTIPWISISLLLADFAYFTALHQPDALVSLISPLRRTSVVIPFLIGVFVFKEKGFRLKAICLAGLLLGVFILALA